LRKEIDVLKIAITCIVLGFIVLAGIPIPDASPSKVFIIGDSTAASYPDSMYPLTGWGQVLQNEDIVLLLDKLLKSSISTILTLTIQEYATILLFLLIKSGL